MDSEDLFIILGLDIILDIDITDILIIYIMEDQLLQLLLLPQPVLQVVIPITTTTLTTTLTTTTTTLTTVTTTTIKLLLLLLLLQLVQHIALFISMAIIPILTTNTTISIA
jgi:hypothetical protein